MDKITRNRWKKEDDEYTAWLRDEAIAEEKWRIDEFWRGVAEWERKIKQLQRDMRATEKLVGY